METIYDFNPSKSEIQEYGLGGKETYMKYIDESSALSDLAYMLYDRNDARYEKYAKQLPDYMQEEFYRIIHHP